VAEPDELLRLKSFALDRVREAVYLIDRDARFVYVNEEAHRSLGYDGDEFLRMTVMEGKSIDAGRRDRHRQFAG
jgi:PAS domain S-box-containing protein